jgi:seryl-tRNA synthetase
MRTRIGRNRQFEQSFDEDDEVDLHKLREEIKKLSEQNRELASDLAEAQSRCDDIMASIAELEKIDFEHGALRQQWMESLVQGDSLRKRLEICIEANADRMARLRQSRNLTDQSHQNEISF